MHDAIRQHAEHPAHPVEPMDGAAIEIANLRRVFDAGQLPAVERLTLHIPAGEFVAILGPSGCGKSTLLRMIAGLDRPTEGHVSFNAAPPPPGSTVESATPGERTRVAYVFQDAHLIPWRNVLRNVELPLELQHWPRVRRREASLVALAQVGLADAIWRYPAQLSGGMRMRVSLARALVTNPNILLLDEPFAALDEITRHQLDEQLHALWRERGMTVVFVTHSIMEAAFLAQRAIVLTRRPARIVLDHRLALPQERMPHLRSDPQFAKQMGILLDALTRGGHQ
jgi:NitT/TauT family transport system ATP-binding protein